MTQKSVRTPKGTELPLLDLRGKGYLQVAHRLQWFNEETESFEIKTDILRMEKDESVVKATVTVFDKETGKIIKTASATKREDSRGFADHLEKAESSACGRALAMLGFGTQFALSDLDEGNRLADSPLTSVRESKTETVAAAPTQSVVTSKEETTTEAKAAPAKFNPRSRAKAMDI